jgi:hypothetical protein
LWLGLAARINRLAIGNFALPGLMEPSGRATNPTLVGPGSGVYAETFMLNLEA